MNGRGVVKKSKLVWTQRWEFLVCGSGYQRLFDQVAMDEIKKENDKKNRCL